jgi:hypothetical protein
VSFQLYNTLTAYGDQFQLNKDINPYNTLEQLLPYENDYTRYNPRTVNNRWGLSITNLDGKLGAGPDLDSLLQYNTLCGTSLSERDFKTPTPVYDIFKDTLDPIKEHLIRCHILQLRPGGYFPAHIDNYGTDIDSFRLLIPLENMNPVHSYMMIEDKVLHWDYGSTYFVNTCKQHLLFNCGYDNMTMVVLNVLLNKDSVGYVLDHSNMI